MDEETTCCEAVELSKINRKWRYWKIKFSDFINSILVKLKLKKKPKGNYRLHAECELKALGYDLNQKEEDPNKWIVENLFELLEVFGKQGHSGFSAPYCIKMFAKLALFEPLCPLNGTDEEWNKVSDECFQNRRCSHVFKDVDGRAYDINGKIFREPDGSCYTSKDSRVFIEFPYTPKKEYIDVVLVG